MWGDYCNFMEMEGKKQSEEFIELLLDMRSGTGDEQRGSHYKQ